MILIFKETHGIIAWAFSIDGTNFLTPDFSVNQYHLDIRSCNALSYVRSLLFLLNRILQILEGRAEVIQFFEN